MARPRPRTQLGDSHNFGRRVALRADRVHKPRALLWEWLLLAAESPLRQLLDELAARDALPSDTFGFLPTLKFFPDEAIGGEVERVQLSPLPELSHDERGTLAALVGRSLALWSWLGVSDLHWENLVLGRDARGRMVFGPLDIEMILADLALPTETKLLPDADPEYAVICQHACGVRRVLPYLGKPIAADSLLAMVGAYSATLRFLDRHAAAIAQVFVGLPAVRTTPIRVCLRSTEEYVRAGSMPLWPPLLDAEQEQLARGDIPYFFRLYGQRGIHYYGNHALSELKHLPLRGDVPQLDPILPITRSLRTPKRKTLREDGLFVVLGAFDHPELTGQYKSAELDIALRARSIVVKLPDGTELRSARNLSAHVSSVYQPCRCGEVRTVFVPAVTVCEAD
jgi:hypothetical protein